jgi:NAD(P)H-hydrate epimerase
LEAAVLGVHVHGLAGDLAAKDLGQVSLTAEDLIDYLPSAFGRLRRT